MQDETGVKNTHFPPMDREASVARRGLLSLHLKKSLYHDCNCGLGRSGVSSVKTETSLDLMSW